ncbi:MAG: DNRLRE domain-containing protein, partial [Clostridiaceae bacterium]|nr:DNRLRE domain-containing protein [Clostridiaceae bacterium]
MKKFIKQISFFLVFIMLCNCFPSNSFALEVIPNPQNSNALKTSGTEKEPSKIVKEIVEKREKNVKHFLLDDGTYEASVYNQPVHYLEKGIWKDIDNTLSLMDDLDTPSNKVLTTKQNDYTVKIDQNLNSEKLVLIEKDKYSVEWNIDNAQTNQSKIQPLDKKAINDKIEKEVNDKVDSDNKIKNKAQVKQILMENEKKKTLMNISSQINFTDIYPNVDLEYIINSDNLKENIILNKQIASPVFTFNLSVKNLIPKIQKDNSIIFYDDKVSDKVVFQMQAPFMTDANKENSTKISVLLEQNKDKYTLTIKPDTEWLNSADRAYPVTIDPPISTSPDVNSIQDGFISQSLPTNNYRQASILGIGKGTASGVTRSFIKFDLPTLLSGDIVTYANLYLILNTSNTTTRQINAHKVSGPWDSLNLTWNYSPSFNSKIEDYLLVNSNTSWTCAWNVTGIVKDWYNTGNNYGLMLKSNDETVGYNEFVSSDHSNSSLRPQVSLFYINNSGLESYWTYHSQPVNRAGTGYINDYNGNLIFQHDDLSMSGNKMPVSIKHVYNSNDRLVNICTPIAGSTTALYGSGWRLNISQRILPATIDTVKYYKYVDEDGTQHYFRYDAASSKYIDESGLNFTLTTGYNNGVDIGYCITDKKDNKILFSAGGLLLKIIDSNNNTMAFGYNGVVLSLVIDGAGRVTKLDSTVDGALLGITDPSGRRTSFSYNGTLLETITYPDGKQTRYTYYANNTLKSATNFDGYQVTYTYVPGAIQRVLGVLESHTNGTLGGEIKIGYGNNVNTFTDVVKGRTDTFQFNNSGNTVSTIDSQGNATHTSYNEQTTDPNKNKANVDSKLQKTTVNYIKNHNAEVSSDWSFGNDNPSTGTGAFITSEKYLGQRSLMVSKTNSDSRSYYEQSLTLDKGKTYTYSGYIKTNNVSSNNGKGAHLLIHYKNSIGAWVETYSKYVSGTNDWARYEVTFTIPSDAASGSVIARTAIANEMGTAYFDCLQLEDGLVTNRYNLIENPDFRGNSFSYWNKGGNSDSNDSLVASDLSKTPIYAAANIDQYSFKINGVANTSKNVYQTLNISGALGDTFVVGGWAKADSVPTTSGRYFALDVGVEGVDGNYQWIVVPFNQDSCDWQYVSSVLKTDRAYKSITVYGLYYNNANAAYFDGFRLYKEEFGNSYTYDSKGNLASAKDVAAQNSSFEYNGTNDLIKSTDAKGSQFKYEYDNNNATLKQHNLTKATSAENVVYSFTYDTSGNPKTSKVGDSTIFINSSAAYTTSSNYLASMTDSSGNTVKSNYNEVKGTLNSVTDAKNSSTYYSYDNLDRLTSVSKVATIDTSEVFNLNGSTTGTKGTLPTVSTALFSNDENGKSVLSAKDGQKLLYNLGLTKNSGTMSAWINTKTTGTTRYILTSEGANTQIIHLYLAANKLNLAVRDSADNWKTLIQSTDDVNDNQWYFVAFNWQLIGSTLICKLYLNDKVYSGSTTNFKDFTGASTAVGSYTGGTNSINGLLDQFVYSKNTILDADILSSYQKGRGNYLSKINTNSYTYQNDRISAITQNGFNYNFSYDSFGNNTAVSVGNQNLITNSYQARTGKLLNSTYGNGQIVSSDYDNLDRVTAKKYNGTARYTYEYDASGNVGYQNDLVNGVNYRYLFDIANRSVKTTDSKGNSISYTYDNNNNNNKISDKVNGTTYDT